MTGHSRQPRSERIRAVFALVQNADERMDFVRGGLACPVMAGARGWSIRLGVRAWDAWRGRGDGHPCPLPLNRYRRGLFSIFPLFFFGWYLVQVGRHAVIFLQQWSDEDGV